MQEVFLFWRHQGLLSFNTILQKCKKDMKFHMLQGLVCYLNVILTQQAMLHLSFFLLCRLLI